MDKRRLVKVREYQRNNPTPFELLFKRKLRRWNIRFKEQKIVCGYIADFFLPQYGLIVEIDGAAHYIYNIVRDKRRDDALRASGLEVLRIRNSEVFDYQKEDLLLAVDKFVVRPVRDRTFFKSYLQSLH